MLLSTLGKVPDLEVTALGLEPDDFARYPAAGWFHVTPAMKAARVLRSKLAHRATGSFDLLIVTTWEAAIAARHIAGKLPTCAAMDQLPSVAADVTVRRAQSSLRRFAKRAIWRLNDTLFARVVHDIDVFLPWTTWIRDSLVRDYSVDATQCHVTLAPQDLERRTPRHRQPEDRLRLLFVGNDFDRKGGALVLQMYRAHLSDIAVLTIATHDRLDSQRLPPGTVVLSGRGREDLVEVFNASDVFVFPTREDMMGIVVAEALASGVPCVATDLPGIRDLVRHEQTGFLMPYEACASEWAAKIRYLHDHRDVLARYSKAARAFAEAHLDLKAFERTICKVITQLRSGKRGAGKEPARHR
jgi:glycosyltransferase involved in cell wall biosynthesis